MPVTQIIFGLWISLDSNFMKKVTQIKEERTHACYQSISRDKKYGRLDFQKVINNLRRWKEASVRQFSKQTYKVGGTFICIEICTSVKWVIHHYEWKEPGQDPMSPQWGVFQPSVSHLTPTEFYLRKYGTSAFKSLILILKQPNDKAGQGSYYAYFTMKKLRPT